MEPIFVPQPAEAEQRAVALALDRSGLDLAALPEGYTSHWRRAALREAVERQPGRHVDRPEATPALPEAGAA